MTSGDHPRAGGAGTPEASMRRALKERRKWPPGSSERLVQSRIARTWARALRVRKRQGQR